MNKKSILLGLTLALNGCTIVTGDNANITVNNAPEILNGNNFNITMPPNLDKLKLKAEPDKAKTNNNNKGI